MDKKFDVMGMTCSACSSHVEKSVSKLEGVKRVSVNLLSNSMAVDFDENALDVKGIIKAVENAGYGARLKGENKSTAQKADAPVNVMAEEAAEMKHRIIYSIIFIVPLFYITMGHMMGLPIPHFFHGEENAIVYAFTQFLLTIPIMYINRKYYIVGFKSLFKRAPNMDSLIAIGSGAAVVYGIFAIYKIGFAMGHGDFNTVAHYSMDLYFESAGTILTLITVGKYMETRSKSRTSEAITKLVNLAPKTAIVLRDGVETEVPAEDIVLGDIIVIRPGQSIPADGVIVEGSGSIDESALTGESMPVKKREGDKVIIATINKNGFFKFRADKVGSDTTLAQIIELVEEASSSKAPIAKLADKVSGIFVPTVITIAVIATAVWLFLGYGIEFALSIGISVLVISCPCALGLATPVAIMIGTGKGAENGILIKSAEALEILHTVDTVVLDKTGTITEGTPRITNIVTDGSIDENELIKIAASIEKPSEHPLSEAIVEGAEQRGIAYSEAKDFESYEGMGISAIVEGKRYYAGNIRLIRNIGINPGELEAKSESIASQGKTPLFFSDQKKVLGIIAVADVIKSTSKEAIDGFKELGIDVVMLTGDNKKTAEAIRSQLGIDRAIAEVFPADKEKEVRAIQEKGGKVAMIGDGINDAPALARADVGIAIGAGTDVAIESADIVLMKSDLIDAVTSIELSRSVIKNIKMNLFWAFFYNAVGIPIAAGLFFTLFGWKLNPMFAAAAMSLSSFCVVTNALRLKLFKPHGRKSSSNAIGQEFTDTSDSTSSIEKASQNNKTKGEIKMEKTMVIEGMMCEHCKGRVEKALSGLSGVKSVTVDLEAKTAAVKMDSDVSNDVLTSAVTDAGYEVKSVM